MYENNEQGQSEREQHLTRISTLEADLATAKANLNLYQEKLQVAQSTIEKACTWFEDMLAGDTDASNTVEEFKELIDILGVEATREVRLEIEVTWRGTIQLPYGIDVEDLDIDDFNLSDPQHNYHDSDFSWDGIADYSISER